MCAGSQLMSARTRSIILCGSWSSSNSPMEQIRSTFTGMSTSGVVSSVDFTTPPQHIETFGEGNLHIVIYTGTLYERGATTPLGKVYIDIARFYPGVID